MKRTRKTSLAKYCGPAVVSYMLGIPRTKAAELLLSKEPRSRGGFDFFSVLEVLAETKPNRRTRVRRGGWKVWIWKPQEGPRLQSWLAKGYHMPNRPAMVLAGDHLYVVWNRKIVEDNGLFAPQARVHLVAWLLPTVPMRQMPRQPEEPPTQQTARRKATVPDTRRKTERG